MPTASDAKQPAQIPGDAESPPDKPVTPGLKRALEQPDKTEPIQTEQTAGNQRSR